MKLLQLAFLDQFTDVLEDGEAVPVKVFLRDEVCRGGAVKGIVTAVRGIDAAHDGHMTVVLILTIKDDILYADCYLVALKELNEFFFSS